ncbi:MAG: hypothetical protein ABMA00_16835 [Gemmatimonas sp.]
MLKKFIGTMAVALLMAAPAQQAAAQLAKGYTDIGVVVGLGSIGESSLALGGRFEHVFKELPDLGGGTLGIGIGVTRYSWSSQYYSVSYLPVGATANYHFKLANTKLDAFLGAGLGYQIITCDDKTGFPTGFGCNYNSGLYFVGRAGGRYFFTEKVAAYADVGAGGAALNIGLVFKLK